MPQTRYRGRFAPSPTGDLHLGSLLAAIASYCHAKAAGGEWQVRIEDIDETRTVPGAADQIIQTLANYGLRSDQPVIYQTAPDRQLAYQKALDRLAELNLTYRCRCTRRMLANSSVYPGTCRDQNIPAGQLHSIRLKTQGEVYHFMDGWQGSQGQDIGEQSGDFNIKRKDGLFCYQLAVVVDDADQGITDVVRGIDIMDSTARQMHLIQLLDLPQPKYAHFPIIVDANNHKFSKQNHAKPISAEDPYEMTLLILRLLRQDLPKMTDGSQPALLAHAVKHWQPDRLSNLKSMTY